jgi:opacity protein-like surface antigen
MKKIVLLVSVAFLGFAAKAQNFYAELNVGYGLGMPTSSLGVENYMDLAGDGSYSKAITGTLGGGLNLSLAPGYMINKYIGVELGLNYFMGSKVVVSNTHTSNSEIYDKSTASSNQFRIIPSVVFNTGGEKLYGYAKAGLVLPVFGETTGVREASQLTPLGVIKTDVSTTTLGNFTVGFRGSVGLGYNVSSLIGINLEVYHTSLTINPKSRVIDSYSVAGQDALALAKPYDKEINYVNEVNTSSNNASYNPDYSKDSAKEEIGQKNNFSNLGVALGIRFNF